MENSVTSGRRWLISGKVQGVGFRWFVLRIAQELGLEGTVRNLPDGCVEVVARGERSCVDGLQKRLAQGPPTARVRRLDSQPLEDSVTLAGFRLLP